MKMLCFNTTGTKLGNREENISGRISKRSWKFYSGYSYVENITLTKNLKYLLLQAFLYWIC